MLAGELNDARPDTSVADVLMHDAPFTADPYESSKYIDGDVQAVSARALVYDAEGTVVDWPWESAPPRHTGGKRRRHRIDNVVTRGLFASTADGKMGNNSTGVRKWRAFCAAEGTIPGRPMDSTAPLVAKLEE